MTSVTIPAILDGTFFQIVGRDLTGNVKARCIECERIKKKQVLICGRLSVTSNFVKHLKTRHEELFAIFENEKSTKGGRRGRKAKIPKQLSESGTTGMKGPSSAVVDPGTSESEFSDEEGNTDVVHHNFRWYLRPDRVLHQLKSFYLGQEGIPTDVTLFSSDGKGVEAHRLILALCSSYFQKLFAQIGQNVMSTTGVSDKSGPAVIVLANVPAAMLDHLVQFMYTGEVSVTEEEKEEFERLCRLFQIDGVSPCTTASDNPKVIQVKVVGGERDYRQTTFKTADSVEVYSEVEPDSPESDSPERGHRICKIEPRDDDNFENCNVDFDSDTSPIFPEEDYAEDPDYDGHGRNGHSRKKRKSKPASARPHPESISQEKHSDTCSESDPQPKKRGRGRPKVVKDPPKITDSPAAPPQFSQPLGTGSSTQAPPPPAPQPSQEQQQTPSSPSNNTIPSGSGYPDWSSSSSYNIQHF